MSIGNPNFSGVPDGRRARRARALAQGAQIESPPNPAHRVTLGGKCAAERQGQRLSLMSSKETPETAEKLSRQVCSAARLAPVAWLVSYRTE
jgi:hypothetical protein